MDDVKNGIEELKDFIRHDLENKRSQTDAKAMLTSYHIICEQTEYMTLDEELDDLFAEWLSENALLALSTPKAMERYFCKFLELEPGPTPERMAELSGDYYFDTDRNGRKHIVFTKGVDNTGEKNDDMIPENPEEHPVSDPVAGLGLTTI